MDEIGLENREALGLMRISPPPALPGAPLNVLGLDHTRLTVRFDGRDMRLTGILGRVQHGWLAGRVLETERLEADMMRS